ncbi:hypothetical protein [Polyangium jinanense]|uniref:Uncharacterized protein n=1 Tax=Polyangium jinanense TaxID=2829994 RepID=A0A9X3X9H9_9BACT|nr:hypothetical protein [Polyangium jinanense]MDC3958779.1 hypothetical protein [Polyangium jinanense]MDC3985240.1 hypothetical protein [Polyangium jinanense]
MSPITTSHGRACSGVLSSMGERMPDLAAELQTVVNFYGQRAAEEVGNLNKARLKR